MKVLTALALLGTAIPAMAQAGELSLLTWEGYADPSFVEKFTAETGCNVTAKYVGSGDEIASTILTGRGDDYDMFAVSSDLVPRFIDADAVDPIDMSQVPNSADFYPQFQQPDFAMRDGQQYAVPYSFGAIRMAYDGDQVDFSKSDSLAYLWDESLKGKVTLWDDLESLYMAGRYLGFKDVYNMSDDELAQARDALIALKPNIRKYWTTAGELTQLYDQNEIAASNIWDLVIFNLSKEKKNIVLLHPKEGVGGWIDSNMVVKGHSGNECVPKWLNFVSSAETQAMAFAVTGMTYSNSKMAEKLDAAGKEFFSQLGADKPDALEGIDWWQPVKDRGRYLQAWNQVKSASAD